MAADVSKETLFVFSLTLMDITAKLEPLSGGGGATGSGGGGWICAVVGTPGFKIDVGGVSCLLTGTVFGAAG